MSWVATILIAAHPLDHENIKALARWLEVDAPRRSQAHVHGVGSIAPLTTGEAASLWGGWKKPEAVLWGGVLNHADITAVVSHVGAQPWRYPACVQLWVMDQEQSCFQFYVLREGEMRELSPTPPPDGDDRRAQ